jgi:hypothetical protein
MSISASDSTSESSSGQSSNIGTSTSQQLTANGLKVGNSKSTISSLSKNSSSTGDKHAAASALGSVRNLDTSMEPTQKGVSVQAGTENSQAYIESMLARYTGRCSSGCRCASDAKFLLRLFQKCEKLRGVDDGQAYNAARTVLLRALPRFAAAMLYPPACHRVVAVQDLLLVFTEWVGLANQGNQGLLRFMHVQDVDTPCKCHN